MQIFVFTKGVETHRLRASALRTHEISFTARLRLWHFPPQQAFFTVTNLYSPWLLLLPSIAFFSASLSLLASAPFLLCIAFRLGLLFENSCSLCMGHPGSFSNPHRLRCPPIFVALFFWKEMDPRICALIMKTWVTLTVCNDSQGQDMGSWKFTQGELSTLLCLWWAVLGAIGTSRTGESAHSSKKF